MKGKCIAVADKVAYARLKTEYLVALDKLRTYNPNLEKWVEDNNLEH